MKTTKSPTTKFQLSAILAHVPDGIVVQDREAQVVYVNPAAAGMLGFTSPEEAVRAGREGILGQFELFDELERPLPVEMLPGRQALRGETEPARIVRARPSHSGGKAMRWGWVKASPVQDRRGDIEYVVSVFQEITELKKAELGLVEANQRITRLLEQTLKVDEGR